MELVIAFVVFIGAMVSALVLDVSMIYALMVGMVAFLTVGARRGFALKNQLKMGWDAVKESLVVLEVMFIIGFITAAWRVSGTITIFVYYGMKIITPPLFLLIAFLLSCLLSYALGTSFGVAGTVGVIFMALARSGGVDPVITAGVIMSGIYFGDRGSPVSSSANLVAGVTGTEIYQNVKLMMKSALAPLAICLAVYGFLSVQNPISHVDENLIATFEEEFILSLWAFLPAIFMLVLPLLKVKVMHAMGISIASGILVAWLVQGVPLLEVLRICVFGYEAEGDGLGAILNGGGMVSMLEIIGILFLSSMYSGIFGGTKMLTVLQDRLRQCSSRFGRFPVMLALSVVMASVFCNQTISTMMCCDLMKQPYLDEGGTNQELALDMENSVILMACFIPWSIGCSVPLSFMGAGVSSLPFAVFMYATPLCYLVMKKWLWKLS